MSVLPTQTGFGEALALTDVGAAPTDTDSVCDVPAPHELFGVTVIVPLALPTVVEIELVVDVPTHPEGNSHVYDVAFGSFTTL